MTERLRQSIQSLESAIADLRQSIADRPDIPSTLVETADTFSVTPEDLAAIQEKITRAMHHIEQVISVSDEASDKPEGGQ